MLWGADLTAEDEAKIKVVEGAEGIGEILADAEGVILSGAGFAGLTGNYCETVLRNAPECKSVAICVEAGKNGDAVDAARKACADRQIPCSVLRVHELLFPALPLADIVAGGAQAAGRTSQGIEPGAWGDLLTLDETAVDLQDRCGDAVLDSFVFVGDDRMVQNVWAAGRHLVIDGRHVERLRITERYRQVIQELRDAL